jgi:hypothetical protein
MKDCPNNKVLNIKTGKCVLKTGVIGKKILQENKKIPNKKTWKEMIDNWKNGKNLPNVKTHSFWECSPIMIKKSNLGVYIEKYTPFSTSDIKKVTQKKADINTFEVLHNKPKSLKNLTNDCWLVIPPNEDDFKTLFEFSQKANLKTKKQFWKQVAETIEKIVSGKLSLVNKEKIYISTHGLGINWLHVRICVSPKYFHTDLGKL